MNRSFACLSLLFLAGSAQATNELVYRYSMQDDEVRDFREKLRTSDNCFITINWLPCDAMAATIVDRRERSRYLEACERVTLDESTGSGDVNVSGACEDALISGRLHLRNYPGVISHQHHRLLRLMRAAGLAAKSCSFAFKQSRSDSASCHYSRPASSGGG